MRGYAIDHYGTLDDLRLRDDLQAPPPGAGEVLVRIQAAALNPSEWKVLTGKNGGRFLHAPRFPLVLGYDFSGVVEEVGEEVADLEEGDEVFGFLPYSRKNTQGSLCDLVSVPADAIAPKPAAVSHVEAACAATAGVTALQALVDKGHLETGQRVLVNGASGGVGSFAVQIVRAVGSEVWGTCSGKKTAFVQELGTDHVVDYQKTPLRDIDSTFHLVLDAAAASSFGACRPILERGGRYVTTLPQLSFVTGIVSSLFTSKACRFVIVTPRRTDLERLADWMASGQVESHIDTTFALADLPEAMRHLRAGDARGKIAITLDS